MHLIFKTITFSLILGSKFWRCPSRKIFAINLKGKSTATDGKIKKRQLAEDSSDTCSSDSDSPARKKKIKSKEMMSGIEYEMTTIRSEVNNVSCAVESAVKMLQELTVVSSALPIPPSVVKLVNDAFKCKVCLKLPMHPPIIATRCCNTLLGCSACVNLWFSGDDGLDKTCPHCREPRGYAHTYQFKGIDEFLEGFKKILSDPTTTE